MITQRFMRVAAVVLVLLAVAMFFQLDGAEEAYVSQVNKERERLQNAWKKPGNDKSPLPQRHRPSYVADYFPPALKWKVDATLDATRETPKLPLVAGWVRFQLDDKPYTLLAFREPETGPDALFIPFYDLTSSKETYGGGRYLNSRLRKDGSLTLDFNYAYNPFCVYDAERYGSCPLPPHENRLPLQLLAGQKMWKP